MLQSARSGLIVLLAAFLLPSLAAAGWWTLADRPPDWRAADWSSSRLLPDPAADADPAIYVLAARTGGLKGAFAVHSWIVFKRPGADRYERYDKVGWGSPIRRDGYAADGRWYSNAPVIVHSVTGAEAAALLPLFDAAIASYPHAARGDYRAWPGPNSNTFVAHVLDKVPAFGARLPTHAVGRDFAPGFGRATLSMEAMVLQGTLGGLAGFRAGLDGTVEIHLAGLVAGIDLRRGAVAIPALGPLGWQSSR